MDAHVAVLERRHDLQLPAPGGAPLVERRAHPRPEAPHGFVPEPCAPREDGQGFIKLPVGKGTPVAYFTSSDPHRPVFQKCDDLVENKGHQFGVNLSPDEKLALREFLKLL